MNQFVAHSIVFRGTNFAFLNMLIPFSGIHNNDDLGMVMSLHRCCTPDVPVSYSLNQVCKRWNLQNDMITLVWNYGKSFGWCKSSSKYMRVVLIGPRGLVLIPFYPGIFLLFVRTKQVFAETDEESTLCLISSDV